MKQDQIGSGADKWNGKGDNRKEGKDVVLLYGPTGVGKSAIGILLAREFSGEIISADSMQIYKGLDIGTNKISCDAKNGVRHHMLDIVEPDSYFSANEFKERTLELIEEIEKRGNIAFVVGGTSFYYSILLNGLFNGPSKDTMLRKELELRARSEGVHSLYKELELVDKESALMIHPNNKKRIIRALEVYKLTNKGISKHWAEHKLVEEGHNAKNVTTTKGIRYIKIGLTMERDKLYERLNRRCDAMLKSGLIEEVSKLKALGCTKEMLSMQGIGYKHFLSYLNGEMTLEDSIINFKRDSRRLAKKQYSFLKRFSGTMWYSPKEYELIRQYIEHKLENK